MKTPKTKKQWKKALKRDPSLSKMVCPVCFSPGWFFRIIQGNVLSHCNHCGCIWGVGEKEKT